MHRWIASAATATWAALAPTPAAALAALAPTLAAALAALAPATAAALEQTTFEMVWIDPEAPPGDVGSGCRRRGLLSIPPAWQLGDAVAVVQSLRHGPTSEATILLTPALLQEGTAVLELVSAGPCMAGDGPTGANDTPARPVADLFGALRALHLEVGAGLVLAVGEGEAGPAALDAASRSLRWPGDGPRFVAGLALGDAPDVQAGAPPPPREHWARRGPVLCDLLGRVHAAAAGGVVEGLPSAGRCLEALFPPAPSARAATAAESGPPTGVAMPPGGTPAGEATPPGGTSAWVAMPPAGAPAGLPALAHAGAR